MESNVNPQAYARGTSKYFKFVAVYASIGGAFFGYVPPLYKLPLSKRDPRFDQSVVSNSFALPQFTSYFVSLTFLDSPHKQLLMKNSPAQSQRQRTRQHRHLFHRRRHHRRIPSRSFLRPFWPSCYHWHRRRRLHVRRHHPDRCRQYPHALRRPPDLWPGVWSRSKQHAAVSFRDLARG